MSEPESDVTFMTDISKMETGSVVWAKLKEDTTFWPGVIVSGSNVGIGECSEGQYWVFWFDIKSISKVNEKNILDFVMHYPNIYQRNNQTKNYYEGVATAFAVCQTQKYFKAENGKLEENYLSIKEVGLPSFVEKEMDKFKKDLEFQKVLFNIYDSGLDESRGKNVKSGAKEVDGRIYDEVTKQIKRGLIQVGDICVCCKLSLKEREQKPHPLFVANCCTTCHEDVKYTMFTTGEDNFHIFCAICARPGKMFICEQINCSRVFCIDCITIFWGNTVKSTIETTERWVCFICVGSSKNDFLKTHPSWKRNVFNLYESPNQSLLNTLIEIRRHKLRVLSLFDGISAGLIALERLGFDLEVYYSCEIDGQALAVTHANHGTKPYFIPAGDIKLITSKVLADFGHIDLIIGGSPCNDLSLVNPARKGLMDVTGTGIYFFDFMRILMLSQRPSEKPMFWLFENVAAMPKIYQNTISSFLDCEPTLVNARYYTPQNRARLFWGNIPGLSSIDSNIEFRSEINLSSCLYQLRGRKAIVKKINTITTNPNSLRQGKDGFLPVLMNGKPDTLWITEIEKIFGFPIHYTDTANLTIRQRQTLLGRSWSIPVICQILQPLRNFFTLRKD